MERNAVEYYKFWTRNLILRSDFKIFGHKMAKETVKYFKYCMDKFIWARILMIMSHVLNSIFLSSVVASQKKETSCHP